MSKHIVQFTCPNCSAEGVVETIYLELPKTFKTWCGTCYYPLNIFPRENRAEIFMSDIVSSAFLIHSSNKREKKMLDYFRALLKLYGVDTFIIESDPRPVDWLQKSLDGIKNSDFVISFLTKRCRFTDELGKIVGWKAPDKCYEEIAIAFALEKRILALVEREVDPGNVLSTRAWCFGFERSKNKKAPAPIEIEHDFFIQLLTMLRKKIRGAPPAQD
jgi:hypothetical protein